MTRLALAALLATVAVVGCRRAPPEPSDTGGAPPTVAQPSGSTPSDHLAPDELVEGTQKAFGMALPRDLAIERAQLGSVHAIGPVGVHPLVSYFRQHIVQGRRDEGDRFATFSDVRLAGQPGVVYRIRITELPPRGTLVEIDDVTPPPVPDLPNEEARWRQVGLTPNGRVLDPTHLD